MTNTSQVRNDFSHLAAAMQQIEPKRCTRSFGFFGVSAITQEAVDAKRVTLEETQRDLIMFIYDESSAGERYSSPSPQD